MLLDGIVNKRGWAVCERDELKKRSDRGTKRGPRNKQVNVEDDSKEESACKSASEGPSKQQKVSVPEKAKQARGKEHMARKVGKGKPRREAQSAKTKVPPRLSDTH